MKREPTKWKKIFANDTTDKGLIFPGDARGKEYACQCRRYKRHRFNPWSGRCPGEGLGNPLQYSYPISWIIPHSLLPPGNQECTSLSLLIGPLWTFRVNGIPQNMWPFATPFSDSAQCVQGSSTEQNIRASPFFFSGQIILHCMDRRPHFVDPFICWWAFWFFPPLGELWIILLWTWVYDYLFRTDLWTWREERRERVRCIERVTWKLTTPYKIDSQWGFAVSLRELKQGPVTI